MTKFINILFASLLIAFTSCNVYQEVQISKDKEVDFGQYQTYAWLPDGEINDESAFDNDFVRRKVKSYFAQCLRVRKLEADSLDPDLLIRSVWLSHPKQFTVPLVPDFTNANDPTSYNAPTIVLFGGNSSSENMFENKYQNETIDYAHGGVKLTVVDRRINKVVWEGVAQGDLYDPNVMYDDLHPAIHKMMKKFPIKIP